MSAVVIRKLSHAFGEGALRQQVLFRVHLDIEPGEIVILTGPSGSGKTTLLTLCGALRTIQEGSVKVLGQELYGADSLQMNTTREKIGFIFQAHHLLGALTARQNVALPLGLDAQMTPQQRAGRAAEMLEAVGMGHRMDYYAENLSGGQKQRVAIARALARSPRLILADEPTASLDRKSGREVIELLLKIARGQGVAILLVTHDSRILDAADRTIELEDGKLVARGWTMLPRRRTELMELLLLYRQAQLEVVVGQYSQEQLGDMLDRLLPSLDSGLQLMEVERGATTAQMIHEFLAVVVRRLAELLKASTVVLTRFDLATLTNHPYPLPGCAEAGGEEVTAADHVLELWLQGRMGDLAGMLSLRRAAEAAPFSEDDVAAFHAMEKGLGVLFDTCLEFDRMRTEGKP